MAQKIDEIAMLQTHIRHLKHAVASTACEKTVEILRQMLREAEAKLWESSSGYSPKTATA